MSGIEVTHQSHVILTLQATQLQATGDKDTSEDVVQEEEITKYMMVDADASFDQHTYHQIKTSMERLTVLGWS